MRTPSPIMSGGRLTAGGAFFPETPRSRDFTPCKSDSSGGERTRTADFYVANVALYRLSYTPVGFPDRIPSPNGVAFAWTTLRPRPLSLLLHRPLDGISEGGLQHGGGHV
jgi:hypothetical protein